MFTLTIETTGAAFTIESNGDDNGAPDIGPELARILRKIADDIDGVIEAGLDGTARDRNGSTVARWSLTDD